MSTILVARAQASIQTAKLISQKDLNPERRLNDLKWFDYRFMAPINATALFRAEYIEQYRHQYGKNIDTYESKWKFGTRAGVASNYPAEYTSFWRVRQFADELGVPYKVFLQSSFQSLLRGQFQRIPYINQFLGKHSEQLGHAAIKHWREVRESWFQPSALPHYRNEYFRGLPAQIAHRQWVVAEIKNRHENPSTIGNACFIKCVLPLGLAEVEFGKEKVECARERVSDITPEPLVLFDMAGLLPSCAAMPGVFDAASIECGACRVPKTCARKGAEVRRALLEDAGSVDPVAARVRSKGRERIRKHRAKKRAEEKAAAA